MYEHSNFNSITIKETKSIGEEESEIRENHKLIKNQVMSVIRILGLKTHNTIEN